MRLIFPWIASTLLLAGSPKTLGPETGQPIPSFSLPDQHGVTRTLSDISGPKGAVLVFIRSADW